MEAITGGAVMEKIATALSRRFSQPFTVASGEAGFHCSADRLWGFICNYTSVHEGCAEGTLALTDTDLCRIHMALLVLFYAGSSPINIPDTHTYNHTHEEIADAFGEGGIDTLIEHVGRISATDRESLMEVYAGK
jgi:hypothetical protein